MTTAHCDYSWNVHENSLLPHSSKELVSPLIAVKRFVLCATDLRQTWINPFPKIIICKGDVRPTRWREESVAWRSSVLFRQLNIRDAVAFSNIWHGGLKLQCHMLILYTSFRWTITQPASFTKLLRQDKSKVYGAVNSSFVDLYSRVLEFICVFYGSLAS